MIVAILEILEAEIDTEAVIVIATGRETGLATEMAKGSKDTTGTGKNTTAAVTAVTEALNGRHSARETMTAPDHYAMNVIMIDLLETETMIAITNERVATRDTNPEETTEGMTSETTSVTPLPHVQTRIDPAAITAVLIDRIEITPISTTDAEAVTIEMRTLMETGPPDILQRSRSPLPDSDHWTLSGSMS